MESIIRERLVDHMMELKLFCDPQHGFVPGRSCMTQLLTTLEIWSEILDSGAPIDTIYLDFRKAFDTVPHQRLLAKLEAHGIKGNTLGWIRNFLLERRQRVVVKGKLSAWAFILSGIPQGSVLGPILFVIFMEKRLHKHPENITTKIMETNTTGGWEKPTTRMREQINETLQNTKNEYINQQQLKRYFRHNIEKTSGGKTKIQFLRENTNWKAGERPKYMKELKRMEAFTIFKARTSVV